jgi:hypothetical protein
MTMLPDHRATDAVLAYTAINLTGYCMGQLRTANKRHKRAMAARQTKSVSAKEPKQAVAPKKAKA